MMSVIAGEAPGGSSADRVRVKIWQSASGGLVYNSQRGDLDGMAPSRVLSSGRVKIE